jgi:hypothetical protein
MFEDPNVLALRDAERNVKAAVTHINYMLDNWPPSGPQPQLAVNTSNRIGVAMVYDAARRRNSNSTSAATLALRIALKVQIDHLNSLLDAWPRFQAEPSIHLNDGGLVIVPLRRTGRTASRDPIQVSPTRC